MLRFPVSLLAIGLALVGTPSFAQTPAHAPHHPRKTARPAKPAIAPPGASGNINAPSTDFSKVERSGEEPPDGSGGGMRPAMGAGGIGLGGAF